MSALSSDRPSTDPAEDLFGHAPFASSLADSISRYPGSDGLVLALYGPWGSGKSTVLSYVQYFLDKRPKGERPVIVTFNPWWFSGQENLARAFLGQLQTVLPTKSEKFKKLGDLLCDFAEGVGGLIDLTGLTGGAGMLTGRFFGKLKRKPKDVPALKSEITNILRDAGQRILIVIDDIDRLTPEETRQLFTVIKALADFPNVIYLLAFDREVATQAIGQQYGLPGDQYLEKIIQVPFTLPPIDRVALQAAFFKRLDVVLADTPEGFFDPSRWTNVFHGGIDQLIQVPRDIVRFTNTLSVTYPSVSGEVNPVDFIAIEALRVFLPDLYDVLRNNPNNFSGVKDFGIHSAQPEQAWQAFHDRWRQNLPDHLREAASELMRRLFPQLENTMYGTDWLSTWRKELRVCSPDIFPTYFKLSLPQGAVSRSEIINLIRLTEDPQALRGAFKSSIKEIRLDGISKTSAILERLMDHVETDISEADIPIFVDTLLDIGDDLIIKKDEDGMFSFGNDRRVARVIYHLLKRVDQPQWSPLLEQAILKGQGVAVQLDLLVSLEDHIDSQPAHDDDLLVTASIFNTLKTAWLARLQTNAASYSLLSNPKLGRIISAWKEWGNQTDVSAWCKEVTKTNEGLLEFLPTFCNHRRSQTFGEYAVRIQPRLNPEWLNDYLDIDACAKRLAEIDLSGDLPEASKEAASQFLVEYKMIKGGKNPDANDAFDD